MAFQQAGRFIAIGILNTAVGYLIFVLLYRLSSAWLNYLLIASLAHLLAVTFSFATQRTLVFRSDNHLWHEYLRFHLAHLATLIIGLALLWLLTHTLIPDVLAAQAVTTLVVAAASYFVHKYFTFRSR